MPASPKIMHILIPGTLNMFPLHNFDFEVGADPGFTWAHLITWPLKSENSSLLGQKGDRRIGRVTSPAAAGFDDEKVAVAKKIVGAMRSWEWPSANSLQGNGDLSPTPQGDEICHRPQ